MHKTFRTTLTILLPILGLALILAAGVAAQGNAPAYPPRPTPTPASPPAGHEPSQPAGLPDEFPDLVVTGISTDPATPAVNHSFLVRVTIKNQGLVDVPTGNNFFTDLYIDPGTTPVGGQPGDVNWGVQSFWVPAGESYVLTHTLILTDTGIHNLYAQVDTDGAVQETDEANNILGPQQFTVQTSKRFRVVTKEDFQKGFGTLDLTGDDGFLQPSGLFDEPGSDPGFYTGTDQMVNDITYTLAITSVPQVVSDTVPQVKPVLVHGDGQNLYAVWEDARAGSVYNRDIYFARSSDAGQTWSRDVRVNQDSISVAANQLNPQMVYASDTSMLYTVWQDNRNGNYDIYLARSTNGGITWTEPAGNPVNDDAVDPNANQINPSIAYLPGGKLFVAWQDQRNGNNDIYMAISEDGGDSWSTNEFVTDDPGTTSQSQSSPSIAVRSGVTDYTPDVSCGGNTAVVVTWEDNSNSTTITDTSDIYAVYGCVTNGGAITTTHADFSLDLPLSTTGMEHDPNLLADAVTIFISHTETISVTGMPTQTVDVACIAQFDVQRFHVVWQHLDQGEGDIYYTGIDSPAKYLGESPGECNVDSYGIPHQLSPDKWPPQAWNYDKTPQKVNSDCTHSPMTVSIDPPRSCIAPDAPSPAAPQQPVWRGDPSLVLIASTDYVWVTWSDARNNYDGWKHDVYVKSIVRNNMETSDFSVSATCDRVVNNNLRIHRYLNDSEGYAHYMPASANMRHPSIAAFNNRVYVAWDDDRRGDPLAGGQTNRDLFMARSRQFGSVPNDWFYISPVFDAGGKADWYTIDWWGITRISNTLTLQTRYGDGADWPRDSATPGPKWTAWTGIGGAGGVYDAPGQHLRGTTGQLLPQSRYIQFRVNLHFDNGSLDPWIYDGTYNPGPCLSDVTIHYEGGAIIYLPLVIKGGGGASGTPKTPNDPYYGTYQWNMEKINAPQAWGQSDGSGVKIAVLDSGVDLTHPDLVAKLVAGYDFVNGDSFPSDDLGHGTHVSGIAAAATDNGIGMAGVGWNALIMPVKVLGADGTGAESDIASGVTWATDQGAKVINLSLGGPSDTTTMRDAITYAFNHGVLVVASSGNSYQDGNPVIYPAADDHVLAVAATDDLDQHASYSSSGSYVDVAAPGGDPSGAGDSNLNHWIMSTFWRDSPGGGFPTQGYMLEAGTSQAAPHVSGLAALMLAKNPSLSPDQLMNLIETTAVDLGSAGRDDLFGYGRIDANAAVSAAGTGLQTSAGDTNRPAATTLRATPAAHESFRPGMVLLRMRRGAGVQIQHDLLARYGLVVRDEITALRVLRVKVPVGQETKIAQALAQEPDVRYAELDYIVHAH